MALRLIEFVLPSWKEEAVASVLEGHHVLDSWHEEIADDRVLGRVLVHGADTEAVTDDIERAFAGVEGFRVMLLPVEATLPRPEPHDEDHAKTPINERRPVRRISVEELYADVEEMSRLTPVYVVLVALAAGVAAIGMLRDSVAIVIGSMVIAPLLGPNVGLALSAALADLRLGRQAVVAAVVGLALAGAIGFGVGFFAQVDADGAQLAARGRVSMGDVALGLAVGGAGVLSVTTGVSSALVGVMVAVALLPPLVAIGLFAGSGHLDQAARAGLLLVTYLFAINLSGVVTFAAQGVRPRRYWEAARAKRATLVAIASWSLLMVALAAIIRYT